MDDVVLMASIYTKESWLLVIILLIIIICILVRIGILSCKKLHLIVTYGLAGESDHCYKPLTRVQGSRSP